MHGEFSNEELVRYGRHFILPEVGAEGQTRLKAARVLLVGAGGLGSPAALYLAASGIGVLGLVDFDVVDLSNLHRQVIHGTADVGRSKLDSAAERIKSVNPHVSVVKHDALLTSANAMEIVDGYDLVLDGTDNFATRYLVNDTCVLLGKPNMYGSIFRFDGQATVFCTPGGPCYRCLYPEPPPPGMVPSCAEGGVLGVLPGIIGIIQATEAVKHILSVGQPLIGRLMLYDALAMTFTELKIRRDPACPACGDAPTIRGLIDYDQFCGVKPQTAPLWDGPEIGVEQLQEMQAAGESFTLVDVREPHEFELYRIDGSVLIPLGEVGRRLNELDRNGRIVVHCQAGVRSAKACTILRDAGFKDVMNLRGGMEAWLASRV